MIPQSYNTYLTLPFCHMFAQQCPMECAFAKRTLACPVDEIGFRDALDKRLKAILVQSLVTPLQQCFSKILDIKDHYLHIPQVFQFVAVGCHLKLWPCCLTCSQLL